VALDTDKFSVLAAVNTEGIAPGHTGEEEETEAP